MRNYMQWLQLQATQSVTWANIDISRLHKLAIQTTVHSSSWTMKTINIAPIFRQVKIMKPLERLKQQKCQQPLELHEQRGTSMKNFRR